MRNIIQDFNFVAGKRLKLDIPGNFFALLTGTNEVTVTLIKNNSPISHFENVQSGLTVESKDFKNSATSFDSFVIVSSTTQTLKIAIGIDKFTYAKSSGLTEITGGTDNAASPPIVDTRNNFIPLNNYVLSHNGAVVVNAATLSLFNPIGSGVQTVIELIELDNLGAAGASVVSIKRINAGLGALIAAPNIDYQSVTGVARKSLYYYDDVVLVTNLGGAGTIVTGHTYIQTYGTIYRYESEIVLAPGEGIAASNNVALPCNMTMQFREV